MLLLLLLLLLLMRLLKFLKPSPKTHNLPWTSPDLSPIYFTLKAMPLTPTLNLVQVPDFSAPYFPRL